MAGALVGEAFLSATVEVLLDRITSRDFRRFFANRKLNVDLLNKLEITLLSLGVLLNHAEEKQITNPMVREWLEKLKDAVFDAEDLLDRINTDALQNKVKADHQIVTNEVRNFFSFPFHRFYAEVNSKMEELFQRLDHFANQKDILDLRSVSRGVSHRTPTSSVLNEFVVVGRDDDKEKLVNLLLSDETNGNNIGVITILGMGGSGKTTLAQLLYNDERVKNHFNLKAWACVSDVFDANMVTKTLLEAVSSKPWETNNLDFLRVELRTSLRDKKFLFVLDDFWNDRYNDWDNLRTPFNVGKQGSRIIITTRQKEVARLTHTFPIHYLQPLSHEDCWSLLAKHAFVNEDLKRHPKLEVVGRKIAEKCDGLPLAAKTLGGLLRAKVDEKEWYNVLNSNMWELPDDNVIAALHLSYLYLPAHLKRCFAYCSIFPKDYVLNKKQVVLLWMAEGLIQHQMGKSMTETGYEYFDELLSRSLIQQVQSNFTIHDLVNDLATYVSGKSCDRFQSHEIPDSVRHLSYQKGRYDSSKKFDSCYRIKCLRTFLPLAPRDDYPDAEEEHNYLTQKVSNDFLPKQKYLRTLSLANYKNVNKLPNSIGNLIHLRYLDLSFTPIKRLPKTTCKLYNLQTLMLSYCEFLEELPADIGKLVNLHHLDITGTKFKEMPREISRLQYLQTLTTFIVGKQKYGLKLSELRSFTSLQGKLKILELQNVADALDAYLANLRSKEQIEELVLEWNNDTPSPNSENAEYVLEQLYPSTNLRELTIKFYGGTCFPSWFGDSSFSNMSSLCISDCNHCLMLPPLGSLPSLERLRLERFQSLKIIGPEFYGSATSSEFKPFPSLVTLTIVGMFDWEEWQPFEGGDNEFPFQCLKSLHLEKCPKLRGHLPNHFPSLVELMVLECNQLEAKPSSLIWIESIENLQIKQASKCLSLLDSSSQCLLQEVVMKSSDNLSSVPQMIVRSNCLKSLRLCGISSLTQFPIEGLLTSLQLLHIVDCQNLEFLTNEPCRHYTSIEDLVILNSCHSMTSFPLHSFPNLGCLILSGCTNLKYLSKGEASTPNISSLIILIIVGCPNLENFPQGGLPTPNLKVLAVLFCEILKSLPGKMNTLTSLEALYLDGLPNLVSFPEGGLPANLRILSVVDCMKLKPTAECGLRRLTSLLRCFVSGDTIVKTLLEERLLPTCLLSLSICDFDQKLLDGNGLQHLTSLQELHIKDCQKLKSLPEDLLPLSLSLLEIKSCPLLEERYKISRVKQSRISHIPTIRINDKMRL